MNTKIVYFKEKNLQNTYCLDPFMGVSISPAGDVSLCSCQMWHPTTIGNLKDSSLNEMLASDLAHKIRNSIRNGSYEYCDESRCALMNNNLLLSADELDRSDSTAKCPSTFDLVMDPSLIPTPRYIYISGDFTCNLSCPSCRRFVITESDETKAGRTQVIDLLNQQVFNQSDERPITVYLSSSGEVFASPMLLNFLKNFPLERYPRVEFNLQTNGLLLKKRWHRIQHLSKNIFNIAVTADSHRPDTYRKLRRGGELATLIESLEFIKQLRENLNFKFTIRMVVQRDNIDEVEDFYHWARGFGVDAVELMRILDWKTYSPTEFASLDVLDPNHPLYSHARQKIADLKSKYGDNIVLYHFNV